MKYNKALHASTILMLLAFLIPFANRDISAQDLENRAAQIPRTDEGKPDFSGMWLRKSGSSAFDPNVAKLEDQQPPLTAEYMQIWHNRLDAKKRGEPMDDPTAACIPSGIVRLLYLILPSEILQTPNQLLWSMEWNKDSIRVYLDGRELPDDLYPSYNGFSRGTWESDTLVVETVSIRGDTLLDPSGLPHSDKLTVTMHIRLIDPDTIENIVTLNDPVAFTQSWTATKHYKRAPANYWMMEYVCQENNRNPIGPDGKTRVILQGNEE